MADSDFEREVERNYRHNAVVNVLDGPLTGYSGYRARRWGW
jgi:hypothetical protein